MLNPAGTVRVNINTQVEQTTSRPEQKLKGYQREEETWNQHLLSRSKRQNCEWFFHKMSSSRNPFNFYPFKSVEIKYTHWYYYYIFCVSRVLCASSLSQLMNKIQRNTTWFNEAGIAWESALLWEEEGGGKLYQIVAEGRRLGCREQRITSCRCNHHNKFITPYCES